MTNPYPMVSYQQPPARAPQTPYVPRSVMPHGLDPRSAVEAPRTPWDVFYRGLKWRQGEHVGLIGPTGQGKTTLLMSLLPIRSYVAVMSTKPRDNTMDALIATGYDKFTHWPENLPVTRSPRRVLWPNAVDIDAEENQKKVFEHAYGAIYREGGWCLVVDEGWYLSVVLKMDKKMRTIWTQGRSLGISQVVATQRPAWVPVEMFDQSTHLFFWRDNDETNLKRIGGIGHRSAWVIRNIVSNLERYQVLYVNTRTGDMLRTRAPSPGKA